MNWLIIALVLVVLLYLVFQIFVWRNRGRWSQQDQKFFRDNWKRILENPDHRHRLMEADKLLDHMLKRKGYQGSMGDKLKKHSKSFSDVNGLWQAHKLRNSLAHEMNVKITAQEVDRALAAFRKAFGDIGLHLK